MKLMVISNPVAVANEAAVINGLFAAGLSRFHLRKPTDDAQQIRKLLNLIHPDYHSCIALHQHHEIAADFGITRLHYTERARTQLTKEVKQLQQKSGFILSTSIHEPEILSGLKSFEYVFYGPVFNSLSKPGYQSKIPVGFCFDKKIDAPKVIALGGISNANLQLIKDMNFDGAAVLGSIWNNPDQAIENFKLLNND